MRKKRQNDEAKAQQERQMEERRLRKMKELEEAAKKSRKPVEQPLYTYDLQGQYVDVVTLNSLPIIVPKCSKQPETILAEEAVLDTSIKADKMRKLSTKLSFMNEVLTDLREKVPRSSGVVSPYAGCYRSFIPALGVTFSEEGREPKKVDGSISQRTGRITKTQFQSMLADPLFGTVEEDTFKKGRLLSTSTSCGAIRVGSRESAGDEQDGEGVEQANAGRRGGERERQRCAGRKLLAEKLSLIHICRCRRIERCRSRWSPYH
eukprot:TRINITY_DN11247_c0_g1_i13.p1 TRINITY_DN11247_c0_g1~~TRINITY_DN11247_c0_g1_i13.p1  ORF type:complete len:263 (-),score=68.66 TRINITY_DN11247_c0_g1_i13:22-810(-)